MNKRVGKVLEEMVENFWNAKMPTGRVSTSEGGMAPLASDHIGNTST